MRERIQGFGIPSFIS